MHGLEMWKKFFHGYEEYYMIIGGVACFLNMEENGLYFRATKDFDTVLIVEKLDEKFVQQFWNFVNIGGYQSIYRGKEEKQYYRFEKPINEETPKMIELFTRKPSNYQLIPDSHLTPLHISDSISSLSAILLNDDYYSFLLDGKKIVNGVVILDEFHLIPFKAKAYLDTLKRKREGVQGLTDTIKKHKNDIARLLMILPRNKKIQLSAPIREDMQEFITTIQEEQSDRMMIMDLPLNDYCELLSEIYLGALVKE